MKKLFIKVAYLIAIATLASLSSFNINAQEHSGRLLLRKKIDQKLTGTFEADYRHDEDSRRLDHRHYDFGLKYKLRLFLINQFLFLALTSYIFYSLSENEILSLPIFTILVIIINKD